MNLDQHTTTRIDEVTGETIFVTDYQALFAEHNAMEREKAGRDLYAAWAAGR
jgi:hypothetical protein